MTSVDRIRECLSNFLVEDDSSHACDKERICAIYFSSNGIIKEPKTEERFCREIFMKDRYEWYGSRITSASRHIFVRDVSMLWYQHGISTKISSIPRLLEELKSLTAGYKIVCVGSSAGGYAAMLFSRLLRAEKCFAFSPMIDVQRFIIANRENPKSECWLPKHNELVDAPSEYSDLTKYYTESNTQVYAYFPARSRTDAAELKAARNLPNVKILLHDSGVHGHTFSNALVRKIINLPSVSLDEVYTGELLTDDAIAKLLNIDVNEVNSIRKTLAYKYKKYKVKGFWEYVYVTSMVKLHRSIKNRLLNRGLEALVD